MLKKLLITLLPLTSLASSILLAYLLNKYFPIIKIIPQPFTIIGWLIVLGGIFLFTSGIVRLLMKRTTIFPSGYPSHLIARFPFSISRNPIYLGDVNMALGASILFNSLIAYIAPPIVFIVINFIVIPFEEKNLKKAFGEEYDRYCRSVRRWI